MAEWKVVSEEADAQGWKVVGEETIKRRTAGERFNESVGTAAKSNLLPSNFREGFTAPARGAVPLGPVAPFDFGGYARTVGTSVGAIAELINPGAGKRMVERERAARQEEAKKAAADPSTAVPGIIPKIKAMGATLGGTLLGGASDPTNWLGGPVKSLPMKLVESAGVNAVMDVGAQTADINTRIQDKFSPLQTGASAILGAAMRGGAEAGVAGAKAAAPAARSGWRLLSETAVKAREALPKRPEPPAPTTVGQLWPALVKQESGGNQAAVSPKGAFGVAQLMPDTAEYVANKLGRPELAAASRTDAKVNGYLGQVYLQEQLDAFGGNSALALAAYNAGPGSVRRWLKTIGHPDQIGQAEWVRRIPYEETRGYVSNILGSRLDGGSPAAPPRAAVAPGEKTAAAAESPKPKPVEAPALVQPAEILPNNQAPVPEAPAIEQPVVKRSADFKDTGQYEVTLGGVTRLLYRDAESRMWYEHTGEHFSQTFRGFNKAESVANVADRIREEIAKTAKPAAADDVFPGDLKPTGKGASDDVPFGDEPASLDLVDRALDILRDGKQVRQKRGPTLVEALVKAGGLKRDGELAGADFATNKKGKVLIRAKSGMSLDEAAVWAQERGYLPEKFDRDGNADTRSTADDLLAALREEFSGKSRYAKEDPEGAELQARVTDLDEMVGHLGLDVGKMSNAELRQAIDDFLSGERGQESADAYEPGMYGLKSLPPAFQRYASTKGQLRQQPKVQAIPAPDPKNLPQAPSLRDMQNRVRDSLEIVHRQGRIGMRGALGTYSRASGVVRTKGMHEIDVFSHEVGHALEFSKKWPSLQSALDAHRAEIEPLHYPGTPKGKERSEGFAEFIRWYATNPAHARKVAPNFYDAFEAAVKADAPQALSELRGLQEGYQGFLRAPSAAAARAQVVRAPARGFFRDVMRVGMNRGVWEATKMFASESYRVSLDGLNPIKQAVRGLVRQQALNKGIEIDLPAAKDPYKMLRMLPGIGSAGYMDLMHGPHDYHSTARGGAPGLGEALNHALGEKFLRWDEDAIDDFGTYLVARRAVKLHARYRRGEMKQPPDQFTPEWWAQAIGDFEEANPTWADAAAMVYEFNDAMWKKRFDAGLISEEAYNQGLRDHENYVPLYRDVSDRDQVGGSRGSNNKGAGGVRQLRGSTRAFLNPIQSMMQTAFELNMHIARNDAINAMDDLAKEAGPDSGFFFERVSAKDIKGFKVDAIEAIMKALDEYVPDERSAAEVTEAVLEAFAIPGAQGEPTAPVTVFRAVDTNERGEAIVYGWRHGERYAARLADGHFGKAMLDAIAGADRPIRNALIGLLAIPARTLRFGITSHPNFFVSNTFRDQLTAAILTDVGYLPFVDQARGLGAELKQGDISRIYNVMGGAIGGAQTAAEHAARTERNVQALRKKGYAIRRFNPFGKRGMEAFSEFTELSETGTRLGIFMRALEKAKKSGMDEWTAAREAAFEARDYMDFDRHGSGVAMRGLIRIVPFLNASLQAIDKSFRVGFGGHEVIRALFSSHSPTRAQSDAFKHAMKFWAAASAMAAGGVALRAMYEDDPEYQEVADYLRNTHWVLKLPDDTLRVIPKPFDLALLSNVMERAYERVAMDDPSAWKRMAHGVEALLVPAHDAPVLGLPFQLARNRDAFGNPIVPDHLQDGVRPRDQYSAHTSEISKEVGGVLNISPAQIDHAIKGIYGSWGRDALDATDHLVSPDAPIAGDATETFVLKRFAKDWAAGSVSGKAFGDLMRGGGGKYVQASGSFRQRAMSGDFEGAVKMLNKMPPAERSFVIMDQFAKEGTDQFHPMIRAQKASRVIQDLAADLRDGNVRGPDLQPIQLSAQQRRVAVDELAKLSVAERRNAMIDAGVKGWAQKEHLEPNVYVEKIRASAPEVVYALAARFAAENVMDPRTQQQAWSQTRPMIEGAVTLQDLAPALTALRTGKGKEGFKRALQETAPAR